MSAFLANRLVRKEREEKPVFFFFSLLSSQPAYSFRARGAPMLSVAAGRPNAALTGPLSAFFFFRGLQLRSCQSDTSQGDLGRSLGTISAVGKQGGLLAPCPDMPYQQTVIKAIIPRAAR